MRISFAVITLCILTIFIVGCVGEDMVTTPPPVETADGLRTYVEQAADYAKKTDRTAALATFNNPDGPFTHNNWYIYAYDINGTLLAHPYEQALVGTNRMNRTTTNGLEVTRLGTDTAVGGGGYILYMYPGLTSAGDINEPEISRYEVRLGYVAPITGEWWIGSGLYLTNAQDDQIITVVDRLVRVVDDALCFARSHKKVEALRAFNASEGQFAEADSYIFALDYNGTLLAYGANPARVGKSDLGVVRQYGVKSADVSINLSRKGGGFLVYSITNPATGSTEQKLAYVRPVDDNWWLGSGVYLNDLVSS